MSPVSFLPTHVYREAQLNRMEGKAGRIVVSWNQFARNLKEAFHLYYAEKQAEFYATLDEIPRFLRKNLPIKPTLFAFAPYLLYLLLYSNYALIRTITGLESKRKVSFTTLPKLEYMLFHFYPHRFLAQFATPVLDFFAAIPYLIHFPLPALYLLYLLVSEKRRRQVFSFMWCAGWVNLCTVTFQLLCPTAPPWFVDSAVFDSEGHVIKAAANEAGFHRLDALIGHNFFHKIYSASPLKFGAFPSLHVAWPAIIVVNQPWVSKKFAWLHVVWIVWAAMYSNHHYGVDALGGIILVFIVNFSMIKIWSPFHRSSRMRTIVLRLLRYRQDDQLSTCDNVTVTS
jgi:membrane-associated phospholipid phosphatase